MSPDGKNRECTVTVLRAGEVLQGTIEADGETQPAQDVAFAEGVLSFGVDGKFAGLAYRLKYSGKPQGDTLSGGECGHTAGRQARFPFAGNALASSLHRRRELDRLRLDGIGLTPEVRKLSSRLNHALTCMVAPAGSSVTRKT